MVLMLSLRSCDSRPTSLCFPRASLRAGHFLLLAQEKVTKEKGTLAAAVIGASMPQWLRDRAPGFVDRPSMAWRQTRAHPARDPSGWSCARSPRPRGTRKSKSAAVPAAEAGAEHPAEKW